MIRMGLCARSSGSGCLPGKIDRFNKALKITAGKIMYAFSTRFFTKV